MMTKQEARRFFQKRRAIRKQADSEQTTTKLLEVLSEKPVLLHSFIGTGSEIDTKRIRQNLQKQRPQIQWAAPRMIPGTKAMEHYLWNDETKLVTNRWGIQEPDPETSQPIKIQSIDSILIPLLAFDKKGSRVGYGGGYYDRFLPQCRPDALKIGLSFFEPIEEVEDVADWDVKLDVCVTPTVVYHWDH